MTRRYHQYTRASDVTVIDAETGEVTGHEDAYAPHEHRDVIVKGNKQSDPSRRAANRRNHTN